VGGRRVKKPEKNEALFALRPRTSIILLPAIASKGKGEQGPSKGSPWIDQVGEKKSKNSSYRGLPERLQPPGKGKEKEKGFHGRKRRKKGKWVWGSMKSHQLRLQSLRGQRRVSAL